MNFPRTYVLGNCEGLRRSNWMPVICARSQSFEDCSVISSSWERGWPFGGYGSALFCFAWTYGTNLITHLQACATILIDWLVLVEWFGWTWSRHCTSSSPRPFGEVVVFTSAGKTYSWRQIYKLFRPRDWKIRCRNYLREIWQILFWNEKLCGVVFILVCLNVSFDNLCSVRGRSSPWIRISLQFYSPAFGMLCWIVGRKNRKNWMRYSTFSMLVPSGNLPCDQLTFAGMAGMKWNCCEQRLQYGCCNIDCERENGKDSSTVDWIS